MGGSKPPISGNTNVRNRVLPLEIAGFLLSWALLRSSELAPLARSGKTGGGRGESVELLESASYISSALVRAEVERPACPQRDPARVSQPRNGWAIGFRWSRRPKPEIFKKDTSIHAAYGRAHRAPRNLAPWDACVTHRVWLPRYDLVSLIRIRKQLGIVGDAAADHDLVRPGPCRKALPLEAFSEVLQVRSGSKKRRGAINPGRSQSGKENQGVAAVLGLVVRLHAQQPKNLLVLLARL